MSYGAPLIDGALVLALVLATGCRQHRTKEFVAVQRPVEFENWRLLCASGDLCGSVLVRETPVRRTWPRSPNARSIPRGVFQILAP